MAVEPYAPLLKFIQPDGNGRDKSAHDAFHRMRGDAPYAEKTEYMIDAESIEVIAHLDKTLMPPFKAIRRHSFPVIRGKAPVLAAYREIIRRRAGLQIHMI